MINQYAVLNPNLIELARFSRKNDATDYANCVAVQFKMFCTIKEVWR